MTENARDCPVPRCGHPKKAHDEDGCKAGWEWDEHGYATKTGCDCEVTGFAS